MKLYCILILAVILTFSIPLEAQQPSNTAKPSRSEAEAARNVVVRILEQERRVTFHDPYKVSINLEMGEMVLDNSKVRWIVSLGLLDSNAIEIKDTGITRGRAADMSIACRTKSQCVWWGMYSGTSVNPRADSTQVSFYVYRSSGSDRDYPGYAQAHRDLDAEGQISSAFRTLIRYFQ